MIVAAPARSVRPACHGRPDFRASRAIHGIDPAAGTASVTVVRDDWSTPGCVTWRGVGIGQPTADFPTGTPYPLAHGFDCRGCRHLPAECEALA